MSFSNEKNDLLYVLESLSKRLLFPNTLVLSISKSISTLGYFMSKYNEVIKKSRELILNLDMLEKWGSFYDSKYCWSVSVNSCDEKCNVWINEIIGYITSKSNEFAIKTMITQCGITIEKIVLFFQIRKEHTHEFLQYTYEFTEKNSTTKRVITREQIEKLFPRCIDATKVRGGVCIFDAYEEPHKMDPSDII